MGQKTEEKLEENFNTKDDVDYDSFIDLHNQEESVPEGLAQLKSVNKISDIGDLPEVYKSSENIKYNRGEYLEFEAEVIDKDSTTKKIKIYINKNEDSIDLVKNWVGVDYIKELPLKRVPIKHIKHNVYTIPKFKKFRKRGLDVEKIRELHMKNYVEYNPREKSWDICSFNVQDKFKYSLYSYKGTWSFILSYLTISALVTSSILFVFMFITSLIIVSIFLHSVLDNIPRNKLTEIK